MSLYVYFATIAVLAVSTFTGGYALGNLHGVGSARNRASRRLRADPVRYAKVNNEAYTARWEAYGRDPLPEADPDEEALCIASWSAGAEAVAEELFK